MVATLIRRNVLVLPTRVGMVRWAAVGRSFQTPTDHRDPFDRLLIWTAINEGFSLVSGDDDFPDYVPHGLKICW